MRFYFKVHEILAKSVFVFALIVELHMSHCICSIELFPQPLFNCFCHIVFVLLHWSHFIRHIVIVTRHLSHYICQIVLVTLHLLHYICNIVFVTLQIAHCELHIVLVTGSNGITQGQMGSSRVKGVKFGQIWSNWFKGLSLHCIQIHGG